jgi:hypothetical protein
MLVTLPTTPETLMLEGYGLASVGGEKLSLMVIEPELLKVCDDRNKRCSSDSTGFERIRIALGWNI